MSSAVVSDLTVSWERTGDGPVVVFIHAALADREVWQEQVDAMAAAGFTALTYDRRGHGATGGGWLDAGHTIAQEALDLLGLLDALAIPQAALVGHSYGALVALETARLAPDRVWSLCLRDTPLLALLEGDPEAADLLADARAWLTDVEVALEHGEAIAALDRFLTHSVGTEWRAVLPPEVLPVLEANLPALEGTVAALHAYRVSRAAVAAVQAPALLLVDARSRPEARAVTLTLARLLPHNRYVFLGGGMPLPGTARTAAFNGALLDFLYASRPGPDDGLR